MQIHDPVGSRALSLTACSSQVQSSPSLSLGPTASRVPSSVKEARAKADTSEFNKSRLLRLRAASIYIYLYIYLSIYLSIYLYIYISIYLAVRFEIAHGDKWLM